MPKTYAFWIQLELGQQMRGEGIGEHLMRLLEGMRDLGDRRAVVCAPRWAGAVVRDMLAAHRLTDDVVELRLFGPPLALLHPRSLLQRNGASAASAGSSEPPALREPPPMPLAKRIVALPGWKLLAPLGFLAAPLILLPVALARLVWGWALARLRVLRARAHRVVEGLTYAEMARFIDSAPEIEGCFVPIGSWDFCRFVEAKKLVVQIPDVVYFEFPKQFENDPTVPAVIEIIRRVARRADAIVCASEFVKINHLVKGLGVPDTKVFVVPHAPMRVDGGFARLCAARQLPATKGTAVALAREFQAAALQGPAYLARLGGSEHWCAKARDPAIWDRPKLYLPTQHRPYKNIENVIRAVARLRDHHGEAVTLLPTADLSSATVLRKLIDDLDLHGQVIPLPRVPHETHAMLYAAADLALSASSFEGGFPFTFSEALSVDTPVILARIPVTLARIKGPILERITFDPADPDDLAARIHAALHDASLLGRERGLYDQIFAGRGWKDVAAEYIAALETGASAEPAQDSIEIGREAAGG